MTGRTTVILGATGDIGHALALELRAADNIVLGVGRNPGKLEELQDEGVHPLSLAINPNTVHTDDSLVELINKVGENRPLALITSLGDWMADTTYHALSKTEQRQWNYLHSRAHQDWMHRLKPKHALYVGSSASFWEYENGEVYKAVKLLGELRAAGAYHVGEYSQVLSPSNVWGRIATGFVHPEVDCLSTRTLARYARSLLENPSMVGALIIPNKGKNTPGTPYEEQFTAATITTTDVSATDSLSRHQQYLEAGKAKYVPLQR